MAEKYMQSPAGEIFTTDRPDWHTSCTLLTAAEGKARLKAQHLAHLHSRIVPKQAVYTLLRSVSRTGMQRRISVFIPYRHADGTLAIQDISWLVASVLGRRLKDGAVVCDGAGMDMGYDLVYNLGAKLWPIGTPQPHSYRNGEPDSSGGYALTHQWL